MICDIINYEVLFTLIRYDLYIDTCIVVSYSAYEITYFCFFNTV